MRESSLWRAVFGVERTVVEGVDFDPVAGSVVVGVRAVARARGRCGCRASEFLAGLLSQS